MASLHQDDIDPAPREVEGDARSHAAAADHDGVGAPRDPSDRH